MATNGKQPVESSAQVAESGQQTVTSGQQVTTSDPEVELINDPTGIPIIGVLKPTQIFLQHVSAAATKVQEVLDVHQRDAVVSTFEKKDMPSCTEAVIGIVDEYKASYHAKIFPNAGKEQEQEQGNNRLLSLFDHQKINYEWKPKVMVIHSGVFRLEKYVVIIMIPLYRRGEIKMSARVKEDVDMLVDWKPGFVILLPGKVDLHMSGSGQLVLLQAAWGRLAFEKQR